MLHFFSPGEWQNGFKHGKGVEQTTEGTYEGEWKDNMVNTPPPPSLSDLAGKSQLFARPVLCNVIQFLIVSGRTNWYFTKA